MANASVKRSSPAQQEVCIDLPGEVVRCWRSSDNLKVVLRKHRDVIFDLRLGKGKTYTVEATQSDFYNARDKKLVYARANGHVKFADGERVHLWVTRNFRGALLLKCDNKLMMKIEPKELDQHQYGDEPGAKPAPIIIALGHSSHAPTSPQQKATLKHSTPPTLAQSAAASVDDECSVVCVVEGSMKNAPAEILAHFKNGGGKSGLADIDPNGVATRNWIWGQVTGAGAYVADNWKWLRASIESKTYQGLKLVRAQVHLVRGKVRFYFSGYSKFNSVFGPGGFGPQHDRIMSIFAGAGKTSSSFAAVSKGVLGTVKGNALVSLIFSSATAVAEWKDDVSKDGYDLTASLLLALIKGLVAAALTVGIVALFVLAIMVAGTAALSVLAVGVLTVAIGVAVNYGLDAAEKTIDADGLSAALGDVLRESGKEIQRAWQYLESKFPTDYKEILF